MKTQRLHVSWERSTKQVYFITLDPDYCPITNVEILKEIPIKKHTFPGGESHVKLEIDADMVVDNAHVIIASRFHEMADILNVVLVADAAKRLGFAKLTLIMPYFPGARQDRVCNAGEPLTIKVFTDLINSCGFDSVHILSPHSDVTPALLNNAVTHDECDLVLEAIKSNKFDCKVLNIVCPDAGAGKRVSKVAKYIADSFPDKEINLIRCEKVRDVRDGSLKEFFVQCDDLGGYPTLIVDDIVAYGGTFIGLAEVLREKNCGSLGIFVSHADCEKGIANLSDVFDCVFLSDSKTDKTTHDNVSIIPFKVKCL